MNLELITESNNNFLKNQSVLDNIYVEVMVGKQYFT